MEHMKTISTGHFDLFKIYSVVAGCPKFLFGREELKIYSAVVNSIIENVPKKAGLYLWGRFNDTGWWETIYLGKAGNKKTSSLQARLREELMDERALFWATIFGVEPTEKQFQKITKNKYGSGIRTYRKKNVHFIIWASVDNASEEEIKKEEDILIDIYRPTQNAQRIRYPAKSEITEQLIRSIDDKIDAITSSTQIGAGI